MSRGAARLGAVAVAAALAGCLPVLEGPAARAHPPAAPGLEAGVGAEVLDRDLRRTKALGPDASRGLAELLRERLAARGVAVAPDADGPAPAGLRVEAWLLGGRPTALTRWTTVPWGLVHVATLGLLPFHAAREYVVEVHAVEPRAPPDRRVRVARRTFVAGEWSWLPLGFRDGSPDARRVAVVREGLARAVDDALDAVLAAP